MNTEKTVRKISYVRSYVWARDMIQQGRRLPPNDSLCLPQVCVPIFLGYPPKSTRMLYHICAPQNKFNQNLKINILFRNFEENNWKNNNF